MDILSFISVLKNRRLLLLASMLALVLAVLCVHFMVKPTYKAVASVLVDPRGINPVSGAATQQPMSQDSVIGTYANVARTEGFAHQVLKQLPQAARDELDARWKAGRRDMDGSFELFAARYIAKNVDIRAGGQNSYVLDVSFTAASREAATDVANGYARTLVEYSRHLRSLSARQDADYFREQASSLRQEAQDAETKLAAFQRRYGITSSGERLDVEASNLSATDARLMLNRDLFNESAARAREASRSTSTEVVGNELVQNLSGELARKEALVRELSERLGENHPDLRTAREQVQVSRASLARATDAVVSALKSNSAAAGARAAALKGEGEAQRARVIEANARRVEIAALERDVLQARKLYETALQRSVETGLEAGSQRADLQLIAAATPPANASRPGLSLLLPLALFVGAALGALLALMLHLLRPRVLQVNDLERMGLQVIEVLPRTPFRLPSRPLLSIR